MKTLHLLPLLVARQWAVRQYSPSSRSVVALHLRRFDEKGVVVLWRVFSPCHSEEDGTSDVRISVSRSTNPHSTNTLPHARLPRRLRLLGVTVRWSCLPQPDSSLRVASFRMTLSVCKESCALFRQKRYYTTQTKIRRIGCTWRTTYSAEQVRGSRMPLLTKKSRKRLFDT